MTFRGLCETTLPDRVDWVAGGIVPSGGLIILAGQPKSGKSMLGLQLALSVANGDPFLNRETQRGRVLYVSAEGGPHMLQERLRAMNGSTDNALASWKSVKIDDPADLAGLTRFCMEQQANVVVFDPLISFHTSEESSTEDRAALVHALARFREQTGCAVILIHHTRKKTMTSQRGSAAEQRGSSVLHGAADACLVLEHRRGDGGHRLDLELRWAAEPPPLLLQLDPETLRFGVTGEVAGSGPKVSPRRALEVVTENGPLTSAEFADLAGVHKRTGIRYLQELEADGKLISVQGKNRTKIWQKNDGGSLLV